MPKPGGESEAVNQGNEQVEGGGAPPAEKEPSGPSNPAKPDSDDGWGGAKEAFFEDGDLDEVGNTFISSDDVDLEGDGTDSHLEADGSSKDKDGEEGDKGEKKDDDSEDVQPGDLNLKTNIEDLPVPHKYKPVVQEKIDAIVNEAKSQHAEQVQGYQESNGAFARAFVDIIQSDNPIETLLGYAKEVVPAFNLPNEMITRLEGHVSSGKTNAGGDSGGASDGQLMPNEAMSKVREARQKIADNYYEKMEATEDTAEARRLFMEMNNTLSEFDAKVNQAQIKAMLGALFKGYLKPKFDEFGQLKEKADQDALQAQRNSQVSKWNEADAKMKSDFEDWGKYSKQVKQLLKTRYTNQRKAANESGDGHLDLLKDLYYLVSRKDHIDKAGKPKRGRVGIQPPGKHIKTQKAGGGGDWDSIKNDVWGDVIPTD